MYEMKLNEDLTAHCHFLKAKGNRFGNHFNDLDIYSGKNVKSTLKEKKKINRESIFT